MKLFHNQIDIHEYISSRRSHLAFADRPVEPEKIASLFEAARWAPSSFNEQPWRFIYAEKRSPAEFQNMLDCLVPENRIWAKNAPLMVVSMATLNFTRNGKANKYAYHDVGLAVGNLLTQATSMGLVVHQMGGYSVEKARENLLIPEGFDPVAMIAVGYPGSYRDLPEELQVRELQPRTRRPLPETVQKGRWNKD